MFRKLVSNLSFSPALVGQLGFYARRLRREEATRKAGLILTAMALIVQSFAIILPPESANASSPNDLVAGGVNSLDEYMQLYDQNSRSLKDIFTAVGVNREELASAVIASFEPVNMIAYGRTPRDSTEQSERNLGYQKADGTFGTIYGRPYEPSLNNSSAPQSGWAGFSQSVGWFAIEKSSGNLITERYIQSELALPTVKYRKSARNLSQATDDASAQLVYGGDKIQYHLTVTNSGSSTIEAPIVEYLSDSLEYAQLVDTGGGTFDAEDKTLTWSSATLEPGESQTRAFLVQLIDPIPATPVGVTDSRSYDCVMTNTFGNTVNLKVACPSVKVVESTLSQLPTVGIGSNIIFSGILLVVTTYFYLRSRQLQKEIRIIRRDLNAGTI